jgi:hypothetical protein
MALFSTVYTQKFLAFFSEYIEKTAYKSNLLVLKTTCTYSETTLFAILFLGLKKKLVRQGSLNRNHLVF